MLRLTKIICTIGPSSWNSKTFCAMRDAGMNIARINVSHGNREDHKRLIDLVSDANADSPIHVATMLDTRGAEIRTGDVLKPIEISEGEEVLFSPITGSINRNNLQVVEVSYDKFSSDVRETETILIDNGELSFDIVEIQDDGTVIAKARENGSIGSRRHINLPGADIDLPSITEQDWSDLRFGAEQNLDFLALSFIRSAEEISEVRSLLEEYQSSSKIIAKIETQKAVEHIREIIDASDGIMVARGDLGADVPFENLPAIQDEIVCRCRDAGKPVIIATHMLESMKEHPVPTRAEVTDTAHAVVTGADATMLSAETASGSHPVRAVEAMVRIHYATEQHLARLETAYEIRFSDSDEAEMDEVVSYAIDHHVDAFVILSESGRTARHISKFRSGLPIIAIVPNTIVQHSLLIQHGVYPLVISDQTTDEMSIKQGIDTAHSLGLLSSGQSVLALKNRSQEMEIVHVSS